MNTSPANRAIQLVMPALFPILPPNVRSRFALGVRNLTPTLLTTLSARPLHSDTPTGLLVQMVFPPQLSMSVPVRRGIHWFPPGVHVPGAEYANTPPHAKLAIAMVAPALSPDPSSIAR